MKVEEFIRILAMAFSWALASQSASAADLDKPVKIQDGLVQGITLGSGIHSFRGIPYAAAPVGELRWREPQAPASWTGIRWADRLGNMCMQSRTVGDSPRYTDPTVAAVNDAATNASDPTPESEDCLYLNVWTPAHSTGEKRPVIVWIYGGGWTRGAASAPQADGESFARDGLVFVSFNYRGGVLGYLVHPELTRESPHHSSGNYGNLDQIAALKWVKSNIAAFGGDPANVTVFGESAGSGSINILHASPLAKGLFKRAIGESTTQLDANYGGGSVGTRTFAVGEGEGLKYQKAMNAESIAELRSKPANIVSDPSKGGFYPIQGDGYVLADTVYRLLSTGKGNKVSIIAGSNANDGIFLRPRLNLVTAEEKATYERLYGGNQTFESGATTGEIQATSDAVFWQASKWAALAANPGGQKSFVYFFSRMPPLPNGATYRGESKVGAYHAGEIIYVFDNLSKRDWPWTDTDRQLAKLMHAYWVNFAKTGDPNGVGLPVWPVYREDRTTPHVMEFGDTIRSIRTPRQEAQKFFDLYYDRVLGHPKP